MKLPMYVINIIKYINTKGVNMYSKYVFENNNNKKQNPIQIECM